MSSAVSPARKPGLFQVVDWRLVAAIGLPVWAFLLGVVVVRSSASHPLPAEPVGGFAARRAERLHPAGHTSAPCPRACRNDSHAAGNRDSQRNCDGASCGARRRLTTTRKWLSNPPRRSSSSCRPAKFCPSTAARRSTPRFAFTQGFGGRGGSEEVQEDASGAPHLWKLRRPRFHVKQRPSPP